MADQCNAGAGQIKVADFNYPDVLPAPPMTRTDVIKALVRPPFAALLAAVLCACSSTTEPKVDENAVPTDYKPKILDTLRQQLPDPAGIREAFISEPALRPVERTQRYVACVKFNPKDARGQYVGTVQRAAIYYAGQLTHLIVATPELCAGAVYQPFPELQNLCREVRCPT